MFDNIIPDSAKIEYYKKKIELIYEAAKYIWNHKVPKPPQMTNNKANWLQMTWNWFYEVGPTPVYYSANSPESYDIAHSYSMHEVIQKYIRTGDTPKRWRFTGPKTATGNLAEVEWFIGSYAIKNFRLKDGIAKFTVYNKSGWHSGTRLPKSWTNIIMKKTGYNIRHLVSDAPRGETLRKKLVEKFPDILKVPSIEMLLKRLPSFGGNWEQYYEIEMNWPERK